MSSCVLCFVFGLHSNMRGSSTAYRIDININILCINYDEIGSCRVLNEESRPLSRPSDSKRQKLQLLRGLSEFSSGWPLICQPGS